MRDGLFSRPDRNAAVVNQSSDECSDTKPSKPGEPCRSQVAGMLAHLSGDNSVALASTHTNRSIMRGLTIRYCEQLNLVF